MKQSRIERFTYIEHMIWWEGQINASQLMCHYNLSRDSAASILKSYDLQYPHNLKYDSSLKARVITENFKPLSNVSDFDSYLNLVKIDNHHLPLGCIEEVSAPFRNINAPLLRPVLKAIREKLAIDIGYKSLSSPDYLDRIIEPHSLIFDGLRWHVRAYCRKNFAYRDFVLSRFNGIALFEGDAENGVEKDELWQTYTDVEIMPDPRLTENQQSIIATDFQMNNNLKIIKTRLALLNYLLIRLRLDTYKNTPEEQQIVLTPRCRKRIKKYLP